MKKELMWAGVIGIIFGLVIGFGVWRVRSTMTPKGKPQASPSPIVETPSQFKITLDKPDNFGVITETPTGVTGITKAGVYVVVSSENGDSITKSQSNGTFDADADLNSGVNFIKATAINQQGASSSQNVLVVYSSLFSSATGSSNTASDTASVDKAVAEKLAEAEKPPKAYIGTVTDIADSTIQIKTTDSQIQQIATNKYSISVVNTTGTSTKTVKVADIAIGDFIVAMGYIDGNEVLDARRILISDEATPSQINVSLFKVQASGKKSLTLSPVAGGESSTVVPDKNSDLISYKDGKSKSISLSDFTVSDLVIVVSDISGSPAITRTIFNLGQ
jgi:hypothetical protein